MSSEKPIQAKEKAIFARSPITINEYIASRSPIIRAIMKKILTLRQVVLLSDGRDKVLKILQYFSKAFLWAMAAEKTTISYIAPSGERMTKEVSREFKYTENLNCMIAQFSMTRKLLRLAHVTDPINKIINIPLDYSSARTPHQRLMTTLDMIDGFVCFSNDIVDDIVCLSKIGLIDRNLAKKWSPVSARLWMTGIWLDLHSCSQRIISTSKALQKAESKEEILYLIKEKNQHYFDFIKLLFDLVFCIGDCWPQVYKSGGWQAISGSISGAMSLYKMWKRLETTVVC